MSKSPEYKNEYSLTKQQARRFLLMKQGLAGRYRFSGEEGVLRYIRQAGCIQYDPIDVCGKNAELVLQSRVSGFTKDMLYDLLYNKRMLIDHFDKNMAIYPVEDWRYFSRVRSRYNSNLRSREDIDRVCGDIRAILEQKESVCSKDISLDGRVNWYWSPTTLSRAVLEGMYFRGELVLHHKKGTVKYYSPAEKLLPKNILTAADPNETEREHSRWIVLRRIGSVGLLWNRPSDAWLGAENLKAAGRTAAFAELVEEGRIIPVKVEGIPSSLCCLAEDSDLLDETLKGSGGSSRTELIAPLDNMMWDRRLIEALFGFSYRWEIYTPEADRKYGYYVLPLLNGDRFIGRAELVRGKKSGVLDVKNIWAEDGIDLRYYKSDIKSCFERFASFNSCRDVNFIL